MLYRHFRNGFLFRTKQINNVRVNKRRKTGTPNNTTHHRRRCCLMAAHFQMGNFDEALNEN